MYWENFYKSYAESTPSDFCLFVQSYFKDKRLNIMDCGCGNGRDSYALSKHHNVIGVDLACINSFTESCSFVQDNFCTIEKSLCNLIYSRFTFHSITNDDHLTFLNSIQTIGTYLCIETRSDKGVHSFRHHGDDHYRNFTNIDYLKDVLEKTNFNILYITESDNLAIYKTENPICIRVICIKV
jgi:hypothetical protein